MDGDNSQVLPLLAQPRRRWMVMQDDIMEGQEESGELRRMESESTILVCFT